MKVSIIYHSETGNTARMAALVDEGCKKAGGVETKLMPLGEVDAEFLAESPVVLFGSPNYEGNMSWQMKKFFDSSECRVKGKLGGVFVTQNWPGGGGGSFVEMGMIAAMLVRGMMIYSGGMAEPAPMIHFGAVARQTPEGIDKERAVQFGRNLANKGKELFGR